MVGTGREVTNERASFGAPILEEPRGEPISALLWERGVATRLSDLVRLKLSREGVLVERPTEDVPVDIWREGVEADEWVALVVEIERDELGL